MHSGAKNGSDVPTVVVVPPSARSQGSTPAFPSTSSSTPQTSSSGGSIVGIQGFSGGALTPSLASSTRTFTADTFGVNNAAATLRGQPTASGITPRTAAAVVMAHRDSTNQGIKPPSPITPGTAATITPTSVKPNLLPAEAIQRSAGTLVPSIAAVTPSGLPSASSGGSGSGQPSPTSWPSPMSSVSPVGATATQGTQEVSKGHGVLPFRVLDRRKGIHRTSPAGSALLATTIVSGHPGSVVVGPVIRTVPPASSPFWGRIPTPNPSAPPLGSTKPPIVPPLSAKVKKSVSPSFRAVVDNFGGEGDDLMEEEEPAVGHYTVGEVCDKWIHEGHEEAKARLATQSQPKAPRATRAHHGVHRKVATPPRALNDCIQEYCLSAQCGDERFMAGSFAVEHCLDLKASLVINLFPGGFSIDTQEVFHAYTGASVALLRAIDTGILLPELLDLLDRTVCHYYDGCLIAEIRDYREFRDDHGQGDLPYIRRVLLRPDDANLHRDVHALTEMVLQRSGTGTTGGAGICGETSLGEGDRGDARRISLALEQKLLMTTQPSTCLDPDPAVGHVATYLHYGRTKLNVLRRQAGRHILMEQAREAASSSAFAVKASSEDSLVPTTLSLGVSVEQPTWFKLVDFVSHAPQTISTQTKTRAARASEDLSSRGATVNSLRQVPEVRVPKPMLLPSNVVLNRAGLGARVVRRMRFESKTKTAVNVDVVLHNNARYEAFFHFIPEVIGSFLDGTRSQGAERLTPATLTAVKGTIKDDALTEDSTGFLRRFGLGGVHSQRTFVEELRRLLSKEGYYCVFDTADALPYLRPHHHLLAQHAALNQSLGGGGVAGGGGGGTGNLGGQGAGTAGRGRGGRRGGKTTRRSVSGRSPGPGSPLSPALPSPGSRGRGKAVTPRSPPVSVGAKRRRTDPIPHTGTLAQTLQRAPRLVGRGSGAPTPPGTASFLSLPRGSVGSPLSVAPATSAAGRGLVDYTQQQKDFIRAMREKGAKEQRSQVSLSGSDGFPQPVGTVNVPLSTTPLTASLRSALTVSPSYALGRGIGSPKPLPSAKK